MTPLLAGKFPWSTDDADWSAAADAEEAAAARSAAAASAAAAAPAAAAASAPPVAGIKRARDEPREAYNILGMIEEDSEMASLMDACREVCVESVHQHCFQQDGTRHVTLYKKLMLTESEAAEVRFGISPQLPITIRPTLAAAPFTWKAGVYLGVEQHGAALLSALPQLLPADRAQQKEPASKMHISLYRMRGYPDKEAAKRVWPVVKQALSRAQACGSAQVVRVVLKKEGPSSYSDARVITSP